MKAIVSNEEVPNQTVTLAMSVEEFALINRLCFSFLGGTSTARAKIEQGLADAIRDLHPYWREKVQKVMSSDAAEPSHCHATKVREEFSDASNN